MFGTFCRFALEVPMLSDTTTSRLGARTCLEGGYRSSGASDPRDFLTPTSITTFRHCAVTSAPGNAPVFNVDDQCRSGFVGGQLYFGCCHDDVIPADTFWVRRDKTTFEQFGPRIVSQSPK